MSWRKNFCMFPRGDTTGWSHRPQPALIFSLETFSWSSCDWWRYNNYEKGKPWRHSCGQIRVFFAWAQLSFLFDPTLSAFTSLPKTVSMLWSVLSQEPHALSCSFKWPKNYCPQTVLVLEGRSCILVIFYFSIISSTYLIPHPFTFAKSAAFL